MTKEKLQKISKLIRTKAYLNKIKSKKMDIIERVAKQVDKDYSEDLIKLT